MHILGRATIIRNRFASIFGGMITREQSIEMSLLAAIIVALISVALLILWPFGVTDFLPWTFWAMCLVGSTGVFVLECIAFLRQRRAIDSN